MEQTGIGIANQRKAIADGIAASLDVIKSSGEALDQGSERPVHVHPVGGDDGVVRRIRQGFDHPAPVRASRAPPRSCRTSSAAQAAQQKPKDERQLVLRLSPGPALICPRITGMHMRHKRIATKQEGAGPGTLPGPAPSRLCLYRGARSCIKHRLGASASARSRRGRSPAMTLRNGSTWAWSASRDYGSQARWVLLFEDITLGKMPHDGQNNRALH